MKPLVVLITSFTISFLLLTFLSYDWNFKLAGNIAMSAMLVFTAIGHFVYSKGMVMMIPNFIPFKAELVLLTGLFELVTAVGLFIPRFKYDTFLFLMAFFILVIPANIHAALKKVDYQNGTYTGNSINYLWFRI